MSEIERQVLLNGLPAFTERVGELSPKRYERLKRGLGRHFENYACEVCGNSTWNLNRSLVTPTILRTGEVAVEISFHAIHPSAHLSCSVCGNSKMVSLASAGINLFGDLVDE